MSDRHTNPSCAPQTQADTLPPDLIDRFRKDCAGCVPLGDDLEDFWGEACPEIEVDLEARLALFSP